jgi:hypothetical protein
VPKLLACRGCRSVRYCPAGGCAAAGWKAGHKEECSALQQQRQGEQRSKPSAAGSG